MSVLNALNTSGPERNKGLFKLLASLIVLAGLFLAGNLLFPEAMSVIGNIVGVILIVVVVIFFAIGIMVIVGLKKEANSILDVLLEGSLTIIDILDFIKLVYRRFVEVLKDFVLYVTPVIAYVLNFLLYVLVIYIYKSVGINHDVTYLTIGLTFLMVMGFGIVNKPSNSEVDPNKWKSQFMARFKMAFIDGLEVLLFVFFLTMDSKNLFFLPEHLRIEIKAQVFNYDLMVRSFHYSDSIRITTALVTITVVLEIFRNILKVIAAARMNYSMGLRNLSMEQKVSKSTLIKAALRKTFVDLKDDLIKFITYNTVLFAVFMLFPRLKLLTLVVASVSNLILDFIMPSRLTRQRSSDLISRLLIKFFKL